MQKNGQIIWEAPNYESQVSSEAVLSNWKVESKYNHI